MKSNLLVFVGPVVRLETSGRFVHFFGVDLSVTCDFYDPISSFKMRDVHRGRFQSSAGVVNGYGKVSGGTWQIGGLDDSVGIEYDGNRQRWIRRRRVCWCRIGRRRIRNHRRRCSAGCSCCIRLVQIVVAFGRIPRSGVGQTD